MNITLAQAIFKKVFAKDVRTQKQRATYWRWSLMLTEWATTSKTQNEILEEYGFQVTSGKTGQNYKSRVFTHILKRCKKLNPKLFKELKKMHQNVK